MQYVPSHPAHVASCNLTASGDTSGSNQLDGVHRAVQHPVPPESQPPAPDSTPHSRSTSTASTSLPELWEADLTALLRVGKTGARSGPEREKAQEFADRLDVVRLSKNGYIKSSDLRPSHLTAKISSSRKENSI